MARPYVFPDPNDRSVNEPTIVCSQPQVLGNYNQANPESKMDKVSVTVRDWFKAEAKKAGWNNVDFHGSQCVLTAVVQLKK